MNLLASIDLAFLELHFPYAVFGGTAVKTYDPKRVTCDIDVITSAVALRPIADAFGLVVVKDQHDQDKIDGPGFEIYSDLAIHGSGRFFHFRFDEQMISRLERVCLDGVSFWTLSREDHIVLKAILQRGEKLGKQDIHDIRILANSSSLDKEYIHERIVLTESEGWTDELLLTLNII